MRGAIPPFPQYAFMVWCSVKEAWGQLYTTYERNMVMTRMFTYNYIYTIAHFYHELYHENKMTCCLGVNIQANIWNVICSYINMKAQRRGS
jgi:hypothetical protein